MKIFLVSNQSFLINELRKSSLFSNILVIKNLSNIYNEIENNAVIIYHLDCDENYEYNIKELLKEFPKLKIIAMRNNPNNIEGCALLKNGCKAYSHSISTITLIEEIINSVDNNKLWMYPELMQFLISTVPLNQSSQNSLLEKITIKELEVLELVAEGHNNAKIAQTLDLAEVTVKKHISSLFKKLDKKDRLSLALYYKNNT